MTCGCFQTPCQFNLWKQHSLDGWVVDIMLKLSKTGWKSSSDSRHYIHFFAAMLQLHKSFQIENCPWSVQINKWFFLTFQSVFCRLVCFLVFIYLFFSFICINIIILLLLLSYIGFQCFNAIMNWTCHDLNMGNQPKKKKREKKNKIKLKTLKMAP